jgi:hypothetical protein
VKSVDISGKKENVKVRINELETNSKIKNIRHTYRGINDFKKGDLVTDSHSVWHRWRNHVSQLMVLGRQKYVQQNH